ncbi:MAG: alpha/beta hydrolase [Cyclobacteriaceae bacterium]
MQEHTVPFEFTGRFYTIGDQASVDHELWIVLHGYGQLSQFFLPKFEPLSTKAYVAAPEGLSLFYLQGVNGRVGATWMTREFREEAIQNYIKYLSSVYNKVLPESATPKRTVLFAFSQGVSTLIRWVVQEKIAFDEMILWAGDFPVDVDRERCRRLFADKTVYYVYGNQDHFITPKRFTELESKYLEYGISPKIIRFAGDHEILPQILEQFF